MQKIVLVLFIICMLFVTFSFGAEINVPPNQPDKLVEFLTNATDGDVLLLERGGVYPISVTITIQVKITLKGSGDESLPRPKIILFPNEVGTYPKNPFRTQTDIILDGISLNGQRGDQQLYATYMIRTNAKQSIKMHDCVIENMYTLLRCHTPVDSIIITDSKFVNMCGDDIKDGEFIALRENKLGHLEIRNCTITNSGNLGIIEGWDRNTIFTNGTFIFDHNTWINHWGRSGPTNVLYAFQNVQITNNLMINPRISGNENHTVYYHWWWVNDDTLASQAKHYGPNGQFVWLGAYYFTDSTSTIVNFKNNNIYTEQSIIDIWETCTKEITEPIVYNNEMKMAMIDTTNTYFREELTFASKPAPPLDLVLKYVTNMDTIPGEDVQPDVGIKIYDGVTSNIDNVPFNELDLSYNTDSESYTAGDGGFPLGDLNWFPEKRVEWGDWITDVEKKSPISRVDDYKLHQNYPNPFNPSTLITYSLQKPAKVELFVFNMLGKRVADLVNKKQAVGTYSVHWNAVDNSGNPLAAGVYFYKLQTESFSQVKKMILVK